MVRKNFAAIQVGLDLPAHRAKPGTLKPELKPAYAREKATDGQHRPTDGA
jgi:hypothetical protein